MIIVISLIRPHTMDIYKFEERNNLCIFVYELDEDGKVHRGEAWDLLEIMIKTTFIYWR
jgi:hypothetical protein